MKKETVDVLVAGAGPVGLTTALTLRKAGLNTAVVDSGPGGVTHSYALALHPESIGLLNDLGALDGLLPSALKVQFLSVYVGGEQIARLPVAPPDAEFPYMAVFGQDVLERVLVNALGEAGCPVLWSHRLARFEQSDNEVCSEVDELEERVLGYAAAHLDWMVRRTHSFRSKVLVGADGHHSLVRRQLDIEFPETRAAEHFAVFEFEVSDPLPNEVALCFHDDGVAVLWPLPGGRARWSFCVDPEKNPEARREKDHDPVQVIGPGIFPALEDSFFSELRRKRAPWFKSGVKNLYWKLLVRFERRLAERFGENRAWLAGDAVHLTGPAGIQSMNVGLREAHDIGEKVARSLSTGGLASEMKQYEAERQAEWKRLLGTGGEISTSPEANPVLAKHKSQIATCLPASGKNLLSLAACLGLRFSD